MKASLHAPPEVAPDDTCPASGPESQQLGRAVSSSVVALLARHGVVRLIGLAGTVFLARILYPSDFGVFAVVSLIAGFVMLFGDFGLGASLIQKQARPTSEELQAIFTFQQLVVGAAAAGMIFVIAPLVATLYHLGPSGMWLMRFMAVYLLATSFRSMPTVILTRDVRFVRVAVVDVGVAVAYQVSTVVAALAGLGFWSLGIGMTMSAICGALLVNALAPWQIGWRWNWAIVKRHMRFGVGFQGTVIVAAIELAAAPLLLGILAGSSAVGFATFAFSLVNVGWLIPNLILQVGFPAMSRIQSDAVRLAHGVEVILKLNAYAIGAAYLPILLFGSGIVDIIFSPRWLPAVPLVYLLSWSFLLRSLLAVSSTTLSALGKTNLNFLLHLILAVLSWILVIVLVRSHGYVGLGEAWLLVAIPLPLLIVYLKRLVPIRLTRSLLLPFAPLLLSYGFGRLQYTVLPLPDTLPKLLLNVFVSLGVYGACVAAFEREYTLELVARLRARLNGSTVEKLVAS